MTAPPVRGSGAEALADWVELQLLVGPRRAANPDSLLAELQRHHAGYAAQDVSLALNSMRRRSAVVGSPGYPLAVRNVGVQRTAKTVSDYDALLLLSSDAAPYRSSQAGLHAAAVVLEQLTQTALAALLGPATQSVRFGFPSDEGRPPQFTEAIRWLGARMGVRLGQSYRPPRRQDGGVDVVAWRPFPDSRRGFPVLLVQCTLQRDYVQKSRDIDLRTWSGWLAFDADPMTALAIPFTVSRDEDWDEMAANVIVLDRLRLTSLLAEVTGGAPVAAQWAQQQAAEIKDSEEQR